MAEVYDSRTQRDLDRSLRQLPKPAQPPDRRAEREARRRRFERHRKDLAGFVMPNFICITIWAMTTPEGYFWPAWVLFGTGIGFVGRLVSGESGEQKKPRKMVEFRSRMAGPRLGEQPGTAAPYREGATERVVPAVLFVDTVGSTERALA